MSAKASADCASSLFSSVVVRKVSDVCSTIFPCAVLFFSLRFLVILCVDVRFLCVLSLFSFVVSIFLIVCTYTCFVFIVVFNHCKYLLFPFLLSILPSLLVASRKASLLSFLLPSFPFALTRAQRAKRSLVGACQKDILYLLHTYPIPHPLPSFAFHGVFIIIIIILLPFSCLKLPGIVFLTGPTLHCTALACSGFCLHLI